MSTPSSTEERALKLLGDGLPPEVVASSIGVSPSRISQLMSDDSFSSKVAERRYRNLAKHAEADEKYDKMEMDLANKMERVIPFMSKPMEILRAMTEINKVKRRSVSSPTAMTNQQEVVTLLLPTTLIQQFTTNIHNQVVKVGEKDLVTIQSGSMNDLLEKRNERLPAPEVITISDSQSRIGAARERAGL